MIQMIIVSEVCMVALCFSNMPISREHFQHMKQALEAFKFSNISVNGYGSTTRMSADVLCLYIALYNISCIAYLRTAMCTIEHDNSGVRIIMLLIVLNVYRFNKRLRMQSWNFADWLHITIYTPCSMCSFDNRNLTTLLICVLEIWH